MSDLEPGVAAGAFTKKIGPLPGWAWVVIIAGAVWAFYLWRKRGAASTVTPAAGAGAAPSAVGFSSADPAPGTNNYSGTVSTFPTGQPAMATNASWAKNVADFLIGTGNYSPADVSNAIAGYLAGNTLTDQQTAIVNTAIKQYQTPPEGVLPVKKPDPITNDYTGHDYTVQQGDTLYSIIQKFYGNHDPVNIGAQGRVIAAGNNLQWDPATGSHVVKAGQTLKLYQDAVDIAGHKPDSFQWMPGASPIAGQ